MYWLDVEVLPRAVAADVGQRVAVAGGSGARSRRALRRSSSARTRSMSGSSIVYGSRMRSAIVRPARFAAIERLDQQLLDLVGAQTGVRERPHGFRRGRRIRHVDGWRPRQYGAHLCAIGTIT